MARKKSMQLTNAYETLLERITSFQLPPGSVLSDSQQAAEMGMSRAPVREALLKLISNGLVCIDDSGKMVVTKIGLEDIVDILRVRRALEVEVVRVIAQNGWLTSEQEEETKRIHEMLVQTSSSDDPEFIAKNYYYDDLFHTTLTDFAKSERISGALSDMYLQMRRARWLNAAVPSRQISSMEEHDEIMRALLQKDLDACERAIVSHLDNSEQAYRNASSRSQLRQISTGLNFFYDNNAGLNAE